MKQQVNTTVELSEEDHLRLAEYIREYNEYMETQLKLIFDFDVWYEHTKSKDFPKEWYAAIRSSKGHK